MWALAPRAVLLLLKVSVRRQSSIGVSWEFHNLTLVLSAPTQFKVHREWLIFFFFCFISVFFPSAAKEWLASVVCPCCSLGKEYLSSSDRCRHYRPGVLPGSGTQPRVVDMDLEELACRCRGGQRCIDSEWAEMDAGVFGCSWRWHYFYGPRPSSASKKKIKKIDSSSAPVARGIKTKWGSRPA